jgi:hypothetical protein
MTSKSVGGVNGRECGDCAACCVYLKIPILNKPALTPCQHLAYEIDGYTSKGCEACGLYEDRPLVCNLYSCLYLLGYGTDEDRPDRSGILADTMNKIDNAIECKPLWEGADVDSADTIERLSQETGKVALVTTYLETRLCRVVGKPV